MVSPADRSPSLVLGHIHHIITCCSAHLFSALKTSQLCFKLSKGYRFILLCDMRHKRLEELRQSL